MGQAKKDAAQRAAGRRRRRRGVSARSRRRHEWRQRRDVLVTTPHILPFRTKESLVVLSKSNGCQQINGRRGEESSRRSSLRSIPCLAVLSLCSCLCAAPQLCPRALCAWPPLRCAAPPPASSARVDRRWLQGEQNADTTRFSHEATELPITMRWTAQRDKQTENTTRGRHAGTQTRASAQGETTGAAAAASREKGRASTDTCQRERAIYD